VNPIVYRVALSGSQVEELAAKKHTHNSKTADSEPDWGSVDKSALPRKAHADMGEEDKKSSWKYPHHHIVGGTEKDDDGVWKDGTMYLHKGGLDAAWSAAQGGRSGQKAPQAVIDHLQQHRSAVHGKDAKSQSVDPTDENSGMVILSGSLVKLAKKDKKRREYPCQFIKTGRATAKGGRASNLVITADPLKEAVAAGMFNSRASFIDHPDFFQDNPSLNDLVGLSINSEWNETAQSVDGAIRFYNTRLATEFGDLLDQLLEDAKAGEPVPDVGLSIIFYPRFEYSEHENGYDRILTGINHVDTIDWVFGPAAEGRMKAMLNRIKLNQQGVTEPQAPPADPPATPPREPAAAPEQLSRQPTQPVQPAEPPAPAQQPQQTAQPPAQPQQMAQSPAEPPAPAQPAPRPRQVITPEDNAWLTAVRQSSMQAIILASGLPEIARQRLAVQDYATPEQLHAAIETERRYLAELTEANVIQVGGIAPRSPAISMGRTSIEQVEAALEALLAGTRPPDGIQPLSGIREMYHLLSGDYEMTGLYHHDRVMLANVNSSTMAGLVANALNKRVVNEFQKYPQWWLPIVIIDDFTTLQDIKWITLGGIGDLPTVAEGAAYTELTWDDQTETAAFLKRGGYLGITLESVDKDETHKLRAAPRALAQAAYLTLAKGIAGIFTVNSGTGPAMSDGLVLFHASHNNLGSTALSWSSWGATKIAMRQQTELNSEERLGGLTAPRYMLVPSDLEVTALQILASEQQPSADSAASAENPFAEGNSHSARMEAARKRVIVIDLWTSATNWAAVADPMLYPSIGLGFRYGRTPEIFSVASPTAGLMFTNDVMPVKVRFFFAAGPQDWRGLYKHNV